MPFKWWRDNDNKLETVYALATVMFLNLFCETEKRDSGGKNVCLGCNHMQSFHGSLNYFRKRQAMTLIELSPCFTPR